MDKIGANSQVLDGFGNDFQLRTLVFGRVQAAGGLWQLLRDADSHPTSNRACLRCAFRGDPATYDPLVDAQRSYGRASSWLGLRF